MGPNTLPGWIVRALWLRILLNPEKTPQEPQHHGAQYFRSLCKKVHRHRGSKGLVSILQQEGLAEPTSSRESILTCSILTLLWFFGASYRLPRALPWSCDRVLFVRRPHKHYSERVSKDCPEAPEATKPRRPT